VVAALTEQDEAEAAGSSPLVPIGTGRELLNGSRLMVA
jgi:hypothetical protein